LSSMHGATSFIFSTARRTPVSLPQSTAAKAYVAAGADCVSPFGLRDTSVIAALVKAVGAPVNVTGRAGMPDAAALEKIGVARITVASAPTLVAMSSIQKLAAELRATGGFEMLTGTFRHPDAQKLFQTKG